MANNNRFHNSSSLDSNRDSHNSSSKPMGSLGINDSDFSQFMESIFYFINGTLSIVPRDGSDNVGPSMQLMQLNFDRSEISEGENT